LGTDARGTNEPSCEDDEADEQQAETQLIPPYAFHGVKSRADSRRLPVIELVLPTSGNGGRNRAVDPTP
jgi:hypothetical protein